MGFIMEREQFPEDSLHGAASLWRMRDVAQAWGPFYAIGPQCKQQPGHISHIYLHHSFSNPMNIEIFPGKRKSSNKWSCMSCFRVLQLWCLGRWKLVMGFWIQQWKHRVWSFSFQWIYWSVGRNKGQYATFSSTDLLSVSSASNFRI